MRLLKFVEEQDNNVTDVKVAHSTEKNSWQYESNKTSFFWWDSKTKKSATANANKKQTSNKKWDAVSLWYLQ